MTIETSKAEGERGDARRVAVVIPCYKASRHILGVVESLPPFVDSIIVVDDACPDRSGALLQAQCTDPRLEVHFNETNLGVGGAVMRGYQAAVAAGAEYIVKVDADGQMDPAMMRALLSPLLSGEADYAKGNRFYDLSQLMRMPLVRIVGNAALSFLAKLSTGYWDIFDPTNGYTAIHADTAARLPFQKISKRYFFETDILFRLNTLRAVVADVPMDARYGDEVSNLKIGRILGEFLFKHVRNIFKRVFYNYFLRDFTIASIELIAGAMLMAIGTALGLSAWVSSIQSGVPNNPGTVMLAALPVLLGLQLVLAFLSYDINAVPRRPLQKFDRDARAGTARKPVDLDAARPIEGKTRHG